MAASRITPSIVARNILQDLESASSRLARSQRTLSTGKAVTRPSDDAFAVGRAIALRSDVEAATQWRRNAEEAIAWQDVTDSALGKMSEVVQRARELLIGGANDAAGGTARAAAADEIDQLIETLKQEADASYSGRFVFSGTATTTRPYTIGGTDVPTGNASAIFREVGPGVSVQVNVIGSDILGNGTDGRMLDTLRDVAAHLRSAAPADHDALRTTDIAAIDASLETLSRVRAGVGATTNRLETALGRLAELEEASRGLLTNVEDADMASAFVDFTMQQNVYQSALRAGASIVQNSLLDFLR